MPGRNPKRVVEVMRAIVASQSTDGQPEEIVKFLFDRALLHRSIFDPTRICLTPLGEGFLLGVEHGPDLEDADGTPH